MQSAFNIVFDIPNFNGFSDWSKAVISVKSSLFRLTKFIS